MNKEQPCARCGTIIIARSGARKYCEVCKKAIRSEENKRRDKSQYTETKRAWYQRNKARILANQRDRAQANQPTHQGKVSTTATRRMIYCPKCDSTRMHHRQGEHSWQCQGCTRTRKISISELREEAG